MSETQQQELGKLLWKIADQLRGAMNADDFRDYMLSFLFLRYLSDNYEDAAKKELGSDYDKCVQEIKKLGVIDDDKKLISIADYLDFTKDFSEEKVKLIFGDEKTSLADIKATPLAIWYINNSEDILMFERQMKRKIHYVI
mgnify:CR=1 FL=1